MLNPDYLIGIYHAIPSKLLTSSSTIFAIVTPCSSACRLIHSLAFGVILQHTGTVSAIFLRPAPDLDPPCDILLPPHLLLDKL